MLSSDGLDNQIVGLQSGLPQGPSWVAFGGKFGKGAEEKNGQGGVRNWRSYREGSG